MLAGCILVGGCQSAFAGEPTTNLSSFNAGMPANLVGRSVGEQHWFGVAVENLPPAISRQLKLKNLQGLMVVAVLPQTPAERAGLRPNDILTEIDSQPLLSQTALAQAANALEETKNGPVPRVSHITFLREGVANSVDIMPEVRPENMLVLGANLGNFTGALPTQHPADAEQVRNYVLPNGSAAQIGPGYRVNLEAGDTVTVQSIRSIVSKGKTAVIVQETDPAGTVHSTISVDGGKPYVVEPGKVALLPAELRPLGEQLTATDALPAASTIELSAAPAPSLEQRVKELEAQNAQLQKQVQELIELLKKTQQTATNPQPPAK
jgi:membrane-associated protease RseP (regulator of RpoE activity)